jgi:hypothetical protein
MKTVTCIIPAYNEATRIGTVLEAVVGHPLISEIIVVDDGSKDATKDVVATYPVQLIAHPKNQGKSTAMYTGVMASTSEFILFLDADLKGLTQKDITDLILPVTSGQARWSMSMRRNSPYIHRKLGLDYISGERVFHKSDLAPLLEDFKNISGYGIETFLNLYLIKNKFSLKVIYWENVRFAWKAEKIGAWKGLLGDLKMVREMGKVMPLIKVPWMIYSMRRLMVRD